MQKGFAVSSYLRNFPAVDRNHKGRKRKQWTGRHQWVGVRIHISFGGKEGGDEVSKWGAFYP